MDKGRHTSRNPYYEPEPTSGFVKPEDLVISDGFTEFTSIPSRGVFLLTRAKRLGRWWVLKGLKEEYREDSVYRALLQKEYEIANQLHHSMVVSAISLEEVEELGACIVMEWIDGLTLKEWLAQGGHTRRERRHVADMLIEALAYVHSRQTQHRDLKPSNIMLTRNGQYLKLIDFGLSDTDSHAILKAPAGTEGYMAPDGPSDIYSLGCILRELRMGWASRMVISKCCAPLKSRYTNVAAVQRDLHRCWQWTPRILLIVCLVVLATVVYLPQLTSYLSLDVVGHASQRVRAVVSHVQGDLPLGIPKGDASLVEESPSPEKIITFADEHVKAICVANWDTNGDGELSEAEAAAVTNLGNVFKSNTRIKSFNELSFFTGLETISTDAFNGCISLTNVTIPYGVTSIGGGAFYKCNSLTSITIPNSVKSIGYWAFFACSEMSGSIIIPANVTYIGEGAFAGCKSVTSMTVETGNTVFDSRNGCNAIIRTSTNILIAGCKNMTIPEGVTGIGDWALNGFDNITSIVLPSSLTSIGEGALSWCGLPSITIPGSVTSIGNSAFWGCGSMTKVVVECATPLSISSSTFEGVYENATLYVPYGYKAAYEAADHWKEFKAIEEF